MKSMYLYDKFLTVAPGQPFRLFPFGRVVKGGKTHDITEEYARKFRLPHFKPPIKLGGHAEELPAGGHLTGLEVREDGLYGIPEMNDEGRDAVTKGAYRYQSPEVIWEGSGYEDPKTGDFIEGPLIIGTALLHTPHLGDAAALYQVEEIEKEESMDTVQMPVSFFEKFMTALKPDPKPEPEPVVEPVTEPEIPEEFTLAVKERDEMKAKLDKIEADAKEAAQVAKFAVNFEGKDVAEAFGALNAENKAAVMLAGMTEEQSEWVLQTFKALSGQVDAGLTKEIGSDAPAVSDNPAEAYNAAVLAAQTEHKVDFNRALQIVNEKNPELYAAYTARG